MKPCPYCQAQDRQVKNGKNAAGSVRLKCQHCRRKYTPEPNQHGYPDALRQQAVKMSVDGIN
jgi:transposase-like protein